MDAMSCLAPLQLPPAALLQVQTSSSSLFAAAAAMLSSDSASSSMQSASASSPTTISSSHYSPLLADQQLIISSSYAPHHQHAIIPGASAARRPKLAPSAAGRAGKGNKRRSRASKRAPTTFITTDPTNFRLMVQHVTGAAHHQLAPIDDDTMLRTSPADGAPAAAGCYYSYGGDGIFVGNGNPLLPPGGATTGDDQLALHQHQQQPCFPTLDSWNVTTMYDRTTDLI